ARFLHGALAGIHRLAPGVEDARGGVRRLRRLEARAGIVQRAFGVEQRLGRVGAGDRFFVDRFLGRGLGALARVERVVEGLAVVALADRVVGALEGVLGGGALFAGVLIGAGGAGRVDRALRLLHFLVGGIAARRTRD